MCKKEVFRGARANRFLNENYFHLEYTPYIGRRRNVP